MIFLELIKVQSAEVDTPKLKRDLWALVQDELKASKPTRSHIFFRLEIPCEAMVTLRWDVAEFDSRGSRLGRFLVSELKKYGMVTYSVWAENLNPVSTDSP